MEGVMNNSACCGGGGGNVFTDILGRGAEAPARVRVREAAETGASVIAVACPACARMLDDAVKAEGLEDRLNVMDIAEIIETSL
jgi:Fe-S oxidoreductase